MKKKLDNKGEKREGKIEIKREGKRGKRERESERGRDANFEMHSSKL